MWDTVKDSFFGLVLPIAVAGKTDQFDTARCLHVHDIVDPSEMLAVDLHNRSRQEACSLKLHGDLPKLLPAPHRAAPLDARVAPAAIPFRLVCISDTHLKHRELRNLPMGDVLVHAGDILLCNRFFSTKHSVELLKEFNTWLGEQPHPVKIVVAGNHDKVIEKLGADQVRSILTNATYLEYDEVSVPHPRHRDARPLRVFGTPFSRGASDNKAFQFQHVKRQPFPPSRMPSRFLLADACVEVGEAASPATRGSSPLVDVFVTHDYMLPVVAGASGKLASVHIGGHIHGRYGARYESDGLGGRFRSVVACTLDGKYKLANPPVVVDVIPGSP